MMNKYAKLTLPNLGVEITVAPDMGSSYMRLHFAMVEARLHMFDPFDGGGEVEDMTKSMSSQWRGNLLEEWQSIMVESKQADWPEAL